MISNTELHKIIEFDANTGVMIRIAATYGRRFGAKTGWTDVHGYKRVMINGVKYYQHHLAWLYVYGVWPQKHIDHINRCKSDNRIVNLRLVEHHENMQNKALQSNNKSGITGVCFCNSVGKWKAQIGHKGKNIQLGCFDSCEVAHAAYLAAKAKYHKY